MNRKRDKKPRSESSTSALAAIVASAIPLPDCPDHVTLRPQDRPFWDAILRARARDEWTATDLVVGGQLARCQADIETESKALNGESTVVLNHRNTLVANPRVSVLEQLTRRQVMLMRALGIGGVVPVRDLNVHRGIARAAERVHAEVGNEDTAESLLG
jgi:hypothetical protein